MKTFNKNIIKNISKAKSRFISIFLIIFLGSSIFAGLQSTPMIMEKSMNDYLNDNNYWDLSVVGTYGFKQGEVESLLEIENVEDVNLINRFDVVFENDTKTLGMVGYGYNDFSKSNLDLDSGSFPIAKDECVIDKTFSQVEGIEIGDLIELENDQGIEEFKVTAIANSSNYIAKAFRGINSINEGENYGFFAILNSGNENWIMPQDLYDIFDGYVYNQVDIQIADDQIFSSAYDQELEKVSQDVMAVLEPLYKAKYDQVIADTNEQIQEEQAKLDDALAKYQDGLVEYNEGLDQYNQGTDLLAQGNLDYQSGLAKYNQGLQEYLDGKEEYEYGLQKYNQGLGEYEAGLATYNSNLDIYNQSLATYQIQKADFDEAYEDYFLVDEQTRILLDGQKAELEAAKAELDATKSVLDQTEATLSQSKSQLDENKVLLDATKIQLDQAQGELESSKVTLDTAKNELAANDVELAKAKSLLDESKVELDDAKVQIDDGYLEIEKAKADLEDFEQGKLFTFTKDQNEGIDSFTQNAQAIQSLSYLFPIIFFLVAALVAMTTMTRMVEEQRIHNGTLLSLGYSKRNILNSYLLFVIIATLPATLIGVVFGINFFPAFIYYLYNLMMYDVFAPTKIFFDPGIVIITLLISVGIIMAVTWLVAAKELQEKPANLLRPKPPKQGKRILLERITPLWKRLSFNNKVTLRNIFRYKRRFLMSIIGIAGCTSLIVVAFGIKYSISQSLQRQFEQINLYDCEISYVSDSSNEQITELSDQLGNEGLLVNNYYKSIVEIDDKYVTLNVEVDDNYDKLLSLNEDGEKITIDDNTVAINHKLAEQLNVNVGDEIEILYQDDYYPVTVSNIITYYYGNVVYMNQSNFESLTDNSVTINKALVKGDLTKLDNDLIISQETNGEQQEEFKGQIQSIDTVIIILIVAAGFLALIVIYNLTNINIQERIVEVATIKVLGFYPREIYDYIFRENIYLSVIGSIVGLAAGKIIHYYLIITVELESVAFVRTVSWQTHVISFLITMAFTIAINFLMRRIVDNVDMIESLKSVE